MSEELFVAAALFCGLCDRQLVSNPLRGVPSFICSPTGRGGCGKIRIQSDFVERFLVERIREHVSALEEPGQARIRVALRQLQDDHYDGLLDRADFLRQSQRLRAALASRRDGEPLRREWTDADLRVVLRRALERVVVHPHPAGQPASHLVWSARSALLQERLALTWH